MFQSDFFNHIRFFHCSEYIQCHNFIRISDSLPKMIEFVLKLTYFLFVFTFSANRFFSFGVSSHEWRELTHNVHVPVESVLGYASYFRMPSEQFFSSHKCFKIIKVWAIFFLIFLPNKWPKFYLICSWDLMPCQIHTILI